MNPKFPSELGGIKVEININIEDYLSQEEMKEIVKEQFSQAVKEQFRKPSDIERVMTNLSYEYLFKAVSEAIGKDSVEFIKDKVVNLLQDDSHISYLMWRRKDAWENDESPAITAMNNAIKDNEDLIKSRVYSLISNYDFNEVKDEIYTVLCESLQRQLFGNRE